MFVNANKLMFSHPLFLVYPGLCICCRGRVQPVRGGPAGHLCTKGGIAMLTVTNLSIRTKQTKGNPCALRQLLRKKTERPLV